MKSFITKSTLLVSWLFISACGAGSPSMPAQIPTSIEFASGKVADLAVVQMEKSALLHAYDADHELVDVSAVSCYLIDPQGSEVTDGSCGTLTLQTTDISYLAPLTFAPNLLSQCDIKCDKKDDMTPLGTQPVFITLNPDKLISSYTFESSTVRDTGIDTKVAEYNGVLHTCFIGVVYRQPPECVQEGWFTEGIYYSSSTDYGVTWREPVKITDADASDQCEIAVNGDLIAITWQGVASLLPDAIYNDNVSFLDMNGAILAEKTILNGVYGGMNSHVELSSDGTAYIFSAKWATGDHGVYFTSCTTAACSQSVRLSDSGDQAPQIPQLAYYENNDKSISKIYGTLTSTDQGTHVTTISLMEYNIITSELNNHPIIDTTADIGDLIGSSVTVDRYGIPMITFIAENVTGLGLVTTIYISKYDGTDPVYYPVTPVEDVNLPITNSIFVTLDNYVHTIYIAYGGMSGVPGLHHSIGHFNDSEYVSDNSAMIEQDFELNTMELNMATDNVGRAYLFWNNVDVNPDGSLNARTTYMLKGKVLSN